jgi:hypothetical protein
MSRCLLSNAEATQAQTRKATTMSKTLKNTTADQASENVPDIQFAGDRDMFKLLTKAWSKKEGWMKSTKAANVPGGVLVQVSTQQGDHVAVALAFIPHAQVMNVGDSYQLVG